MSTSKKLIIKPGIDNNSNTLSNVADPISSQDAATKNYIDSSIGNLVHITGTETISGVKSFSSGFDITSANNAADGASQLYLNGATGNRIDFNVNGTAIPAFTTRSVGTKIVLYPGITASTVDYGLGIEASNLWFSTSSTSTGFKWYGGTTVAATLSGAGAFVATGNVTAFSDERLKENIEIIPNALDKVESIRGVTYNRKDIIDNPRHTGVIAQDIQKVLPEAIETSDDGTLSVAYGNLVGLLVEAIKELNNKIKYLENKLNT